MGTAPRSDENTQTPTTGDFETFYRNRYSAISRYVARRVPADSHDEVVATTFIAAWRKFSVAKSPSLPWLYRIASFEVSHEQRRLGRQARVVELNDLPLIDTASMEEVFDTSKAFSQLPESDAELLRLTNGTAMACLMDFAEPKDRVHFWSDLTMPDAWVLSEENISRLYTVGA